VKTFNAKDFVNRECRRQWAKPPIPGLDDRFTDVLFWVIALKGSDFLRR
jgi:hypothetical protein